MYREAAAEASAITRADAKLTSVLDKRLCPAIFCTVGPGFATTCKEEPHTSKTTKMITNHPSHTDCKTIEVTVMYFPMPPLDE